MMESRHAERLRHYLARHRLEHVFPQPLFARLSLMQFERGERICEQGEPAGRLYVLVEGKIKVFTTSPEGRALVLSFREPVEIIGDVEFIGRRDLMNTVEAVSRSLAIAVDYRDLEAYGMSHAPLLQFLLEVVTHKFYTKSNAMSFNLMHPVEVRLASYLLTVCQEETGLPHQGGSATVHLADAANYIGTSYRHLNRVLRQFIDEGLVERAGGQIRVSDRAGLLAKAEHNIYE